MIIMLAVYRDGTDGKYRATAAARGAAGRAVGPTGQGIYLGF